ncbi:hypothetical protein AC579_847 [Pseudocercospora musae]|uniref:Uncharacterized protein n=1 Tax=Pseudocercospora musae TaxID=113226 RepID=A0A139HUI4_9PEZI|nr:hypothetical protein AC579_847 [Pseudocercospora musae]
MYYHKIQFRFTEAETAVKWLSKLDEESRHGVRSLVYCPNLLAWMDPRQPPVPSSRFGEGWNELCDFLRFAAIDLKISGGKLWMDLGGRNLTSCTQLMIRS